MLKWKEILQFVYKTHHNNRVNQNKPNFGALAKFGFKYQANLGKFIIQGKSKLINSLIFFFKYLKRNSAMIF